MKALLLKLWQLMARRKETSKLSVISNFFTSSLYRSCNFETFFLLSFLSLLVVILTVTLNLSSSHFSVQCCRAILIDKSLRFIKKNFSSSKKLSEKSWTLGHSTNLIELLPTFFPPSTRSSWKMTISLLSAAKERQPIVIIFLLFDVI